jgi:hypothetical protein
MIAKNAHLSVCALVGAAVLAIAGGCANTPPVTPEQQVHTLADGRWQALLAGKHEAAYEMTAPSFRKSTSFDSYRQKQGGALQWTGFEVVSVKCEPNACNVRLRINASAIAGIGYRGPITTAVDEAWVLEDGRWWLLPKS